MKRLFDDPQLSAALRHDLQQARAAAHDYPVTEKLLQLRAALSDSSRQPIDDSSRWSDVRSTETWRISQLWHAGWKLVLIMAVVGTGAVGVQRWLSADAGFAHEQLAPPPAAAEVVAAAVAVEESPVAQPVAAAEAQVIAAKPAAVVRVQRPAPVAKAPSSDSSSRREIAQLVRIRELLKHDPAAAYELAQRSEREFPAGLLSAERQALAILALAKTGATDDARRKANAFLLRYPQSPMREQIEAALAR